jgi:hypothetical protein
MSLRMTPKQFRAAFRDYEGNGRPRNIVRRPISAAAKAEQGRRVAEWERERERTSTVFLAVYLKNPNNRTEHPLKAWRRNKGVRATIELLCRKAGVSMDLPVEVIMTRYGPRALDEGCGLNASLKHVRDGVADYFGPLDNDPRYTWTYRQETTRPGMYGVEVAFRWNAKRKGKHSTRGASR